MNDDTRPKADIHLGEASHDCRIVLGGVDITAAVAGLTIRAGAGRVTRLELEIIPGTLARLDATVGEVIRRLPVAPGEATDSAPGDRAATGPTGGA